MISVTYYSIGRVKTRSNARSPEEPGEVVGQKPMRLHGIDGLRERGMLIHGNELS